MTVLTVYRMEFSQPDGRWTGPYCAEWMTPEAFEIRKHLNAEHGPDSPSRTWPDSRIFLDSPGANRYVCGSPSMSALQWWFGRWYAPLLREGGFVATYQVPRDAVAHRDTTQVVYMQRRATLTSRVGEHVPVERLVEKIHPNKITAA